MEQVLREIVAELRKIRELLEPRQVTVTINEQDIQYLRKLTDESLAREGDNLTGRRGCI